MDTWREDDRFMIALDLPGIMPEAIEVQALGRIVTVKAERRPTPRGDGARTQLAERAHRVFERRIQLADSLDLGPTAAHLQDGSGDLGQPRPQPGRRGGHEGDPLRRHGPRPSLGWVVLARVRRRAPPGR
ncbi:Hsp20/alpha crystallin family protein [Kitasatospora sp. NPDC088346]|uniref:Hsp20/alpha crystallin family protein n=1 Tax=Kitasatospora sp. NPDC088346 TaxID=3364073 RepID=UPI003825C402